MSDTFRVYDLALPDGYPAEWHAEIKDLVREQASHRCVRCGHPYRKGEHGKGEWTPCDERCTHAGPTRTVVEDEAEQIWWYEAQWRILTVHHLNGDKLDCRWWNLAALCQRCHLTIQGKVRMERRWPHEHSDWFQPYVAGYYASHFLGEELDRDETMARLAELLALEDRQLAL